MAVPVLTTSPSTRTIIGTFENDSAQDVFQVLGKGGSIECGMNAFGVIYNTVNGALVSVAPLVSTVVITTAQVLTLSTVPVIIVPSPPPGFFIIPQIFSVVYVHNTLDFNITGNSGFFLGWGDDTDSIISDFVANPVTAAFMDVSASQFQSGICEPGGEGASSVIVPLSDVENLPLSFYSPDVFTVGNGYLVVTVSYSIASIR